MGEVKINRNNKQLFFCFRRALDFCVFFRNLLRCIHYTNFFIANLITIPKVMPEDIYQGAWIPAALKSMMQ